MLLKIYVNDPELRQKYVDYIEEKVMPNLSAPYPDAGFDLFIPEKFVIDAFENKKVDLGVKCAAFDKNGDPISFYVYPRSSIGKTKVRLANCVGIIDSGYRGCLGVMFDNISKSPVEVEKGTRLVQICSPTLSPIKVEVVANEDVLGSTQRGAGGFGSTGGTITGEALVPPTPPSSYYD